MDYDERGVCLHKIPFIGEYDSAFSKMLYTDSDSQNNIRLNTEHDLTLNSTING